MDNVSPSCEISTSGLEAAVTAIIRSILFTPKKHTHVRRGDIDKTRKPICKRRFNAKRHNTLEKDTIVESCPKIVKIALGRQLRSDASP